MTDIIYYVWLPEDFHDEERRDIEYMRVHARDSIEAAAIFRFDSALSPRTPVFTSQLRDGTDAVLHSPK